MRAAASSPFDAPARPPPAARHSPRPQTPHTPRSYYCKYSGRHALTTDCNLSAAPRRRADHSLVVDTAKFTAKLYTSDGGVKLLRRRAGGVEKQYRVNVGKLPVGYRTEPEGRYLYLLDDALTTYSADEGGAGGGSGAPPVPPCIVATPAGTKVSLEIEDRGPRHVVLKISADHVRVQIKQAVSNTTATEEILEYMRSVLGVKLAAMELTRGESPRHKMLHVAGEAPDAVFSKLQKALKKINPKKF